MRSYHIFYFLLLGLGLSNGFCAGPHFYKFKEARGFLFEDPEFRNAINFVDGKSIFQLKAAEASSNIMSLSSRLFFVKPDSIVPFEEDTSGKFWSLRILEWRDQEINFHFAAFNKNEKSNPHSWKPVTIIDYDQAEKSLKVLLKPVQSSVDLSIKSASLKQKNEITWNVLPETTDELKVTVPVDKLLGVKTSWIDSGSYSISYKSKLKASPVIILDPGHGNKDGACVESICEEKIVFKFTKFVEENLKKNLKNSAQIYLTRKDAVEPVALADRVSLSENKDADLFISFHTDAWEHSPQSRLPEVKGMNCFYKNSFSQNLAHEICSKYHFDYEVQNVVKRNLHVLHSMAYPSVLIELGNLKNKKDLELLTSDKKLRMLAHEVAMKISDYIKKNSF